MRSFFVSAARFGFKKGEEIQVLTPMHRGIVGAGNLNVELQKALNPREDGVVRGGRTYKVNEREIAYDYSDLDELVLAYAVSIHKSQGSEYPAVVIPILTQHYILLQRNLLYTGVTRGKKLVVLVGTKKAMAVKNDKTEKRYTRLRDRLVAQ
jgi:exodeoxyribonuclease V alpha subunit